MSTLSAKAFYLAQHTRRLNSLPIVAALKALVTVDNACMVPVVTFGFEVWHSGLSRPKIFGIGMPPTSYHCELIDKGSSCDLLSCNLCATFLKLSTSNPNDAF